MQEAFKEPGGERLRDWIDSCPNQLYSALTYQGGAAWRKRLLDDLGDQGPVTRLIEKRSDEELAQLMSNLGGHDLPSLLDAFEKAREHDRPVCFLAYTIKGFGLPLAGHKDNHSGLLTPTQMEAWQKTQGVRPGHEWDKFEGIKAPQAEIEQFLAEVPFIQKGTRRYAAPQVPVPEKLAFPANPAMSTQQGFGLILNELARSDQALASRIVTTAPDVTVSTNLGAWVNRRGLYARESLVDTFKKERIPSTYNWEFSPEGQHIELGIAEMNLFILLSALGLSHSLFGERILPIGTLYDPFIYRGADALNYACYQDARFMIVATPSGVTLAPEGGAHQSIGTPLVGMAQDGLASFEPAFVDELAVIMRWAFDYMQRDGRRRAGREDVAARRDRRLGLSAPLHPRPRAAAARDDAGTGRRHHGRRLLAAQARPERAGRGRLYRRGGAGGHRGGRADGRGPARHRAFGHHLGRPAQCRLDGGAARPRARPRPCPLPCGAPAWPTCRPIAGWSPSSTAIRRRSPGWARSWATAPALSASSISARPARSRTSTAISASTPRASSRQPP